MVKQGPFNKEQFLKEMWAHEPHTKKNSMMPPPGHNSNSSSRYSTSNFSPYSNSNTNANANSNFSSISNSNSNSNDKVNDKRNIDRIGAGGMILRDLLDASNPNQFYIDLGDDAHLLLNISTKSNNMYPNNIDSIKSTNIGHSLA